MWFLLLSLFCCCRSKLGLFQSRISLQKASVKVREHHADSHLPLRQSFQVDYFKPSDEHTYRCFTIFLSELRLKPGGLQQCLSLFFFFLFFFQLKAKRNDCNSKATQARNDYLLTLAAANAHHDRYYHTDLPHCIQVFPETLLQS